jgi:hypothetical protein
MTDRLRLMSEDPDVHSISFWVFIAEPDSGFEISPSGLAAIAATGAVLKVVAYGDSHDVAAVTS